MATLPQPESSGPRPEPTAKTHHYRGVAESFGSDTERYARTRPPYPDHMVEHILGLAPGREILDVGCGTGVLGRQMLDRGATVTGLDPDPRMAAYATEHGLPAEVSTFEDWDPAGRSFDGVVAGQAWHWIDPRAGAEKAGQILHPSGVLALLAHVYEPPAEVTKALMDALREVAPDSPFVRAATSPSRDPRPASPADGYQRMYAGFADGIRASGLFAEPDQATHRWQRSYTRDEWLDLVPTMGLLTQLTPAALDSVLGAVAAALDAIGDTIPVRFTTLMLTATRRPDDRG